MKELLTIALLASFHLLIAHAIDPNDVTEEGKQSGGYRAALFLNQPAYSPGETIFFKAYVTSPSFKKPEGYQTLSLAIINKYGGAVSKIKFSLKQGVGFNQITIPDSVSSGYYLVTLFQEGFSGTEALNLDLCQKEIEIIKNQKITTTNNEQDSLVQFYFEGGNFITGLSTKVVIKTSLKSQQATLIDKNGREITSIDINDQGTGAFIFKPENKAEYNVKIGSKLFKLSNSKEDGITMMTSMKSDQVQILVAVPEYSVLKESELSIALSAYRTNYYSSRFKLENKNAIRFLIPKKDLPSGIINITIFDRNQHPLCVRKIYIDKNLSVNAFVQTEKQTYHNREKVTVRIAVKDGSKKLLSNLAMTVYNSTLLPQKDSQSFQERMIAGNFLTNNKVDKTQPDWYAQLDQMLITEDRSEENQIPIDLNGIIKIKGHVYQSDLSTPVADSTIVRIFLQEKMMSYEAATKSGEVFFQLLDFIGDENIYYEIASSDEATKNGVMILDESRIQHSAAESAKNSGESSYYTTHVQREKKILNSYSYYESKNNKKSEKLFNPNENWEAELRNADFSVILEDYISFPTMEEVVREIIPALTIQKRKGKQIVHLALPPPYIKPTEDPLYIIDGLMIRDSDFFLSLNPSDIWSIKVVNSPEKLHALGSFGTTGVVLVQSKKGMRSLVYSKSHLIPINGLSKSNLTAFTYRSKKEVVPDFRTTLYWNPDITINQNGVAELEFYTSDDIGSFIIKIVGMTEDGQPFSTSSNFEVKFDHSSYQKR